MLVLVVSLIKNRFVSTIYYTISGFGTGSGDFLWLFCCRFVRSLSPSAIPFQHDQQWYLRVDGVETESLVWLKGICLINVCCRKGVGVMQIDI